jgi:hypothetical protein
LDRKTSAHNGFIAVLVEQGVVGVAIFTSLLVAVGLGTRSLPFPDRQLGVVLFSTLVVALLPVNWDYVKQTWFVLGFVPLLSATMRSSIRSRGDWRGQAQPLAYDAPPNGHPEPISLGWRLGPTSQSPARPPQPRAHALSPAGELRIRPDRRTT